MLHIVNGDVLGRKIKDIDGDIIVWREMYDFGPLNSGWTNDELIKRRSLFFEEKLSIPSSLFIENCHNQLNLLNKRSLDEEVILWFEHDRYDQTMLMYILTQLSTKNRSNLSMVSINSHPSISPFYGLGQLTSAQLKALFKHRVSISNQQVAEAVEGWKAYSSPDLDDIKKWITEVPHEFPFLLAALERNISYMPSTSTGINEIESLILQNIEKGPCLFRELFKNISPNLINDGLSDLHISAIIKELMNGENALIKADGALPMYDLTYENPNLAITSFGESVLTGKANRLDLIGIDWWVGGVHLLSKK
ncbi:DUF1835 domain-containing protein [Metabacillus litoralis]|uniref:DUF1835 domain-containing protein n=1 Tax=Metabacillus litoralis TaxID=152268 RepID=UPI00203A3AD0|nr:DUF1835 domain-containing protein [Metabacillus litoralis]MCM3651855.1 DUF1835 domain-containing protein [Metabacillus litoralis]